MLAQRILHLLIPLMIFVPYGKSQNQNLTQFRDEYISYSLKYGFFRVGEGFISYVNDTAGNIGQITARAQSTGWIKIFKDLDYRYESSMDLASGLPIHAVRSLRDGRYNLYNELEFDHTSRIDSAIVFSQMSGEHVVSKNIFDILTGFHHFRSHCIHDEQMREQVIVIKTFFTDELWDLKINYAGEETINTVYGPVECFVFHPITVIGRFFRNEDDMTIWFTKGDNPVPVKIKANLKLGSIDFDYVNYKKGTGSSNNLQSDFVNLDK